MVRVRNVLDDGQAQAAAAFAFAAGTIDHIKSIGNAGDFIRGDAIAAIGNRDSIVRGFEGDGLPRLGGLGRIIHQIDQQGFHQIIIAAKRIGFADDGKRGLPLVQGFQGAFKNISQKRVGRNDLGFKLLLQSDKGQHFLRQPLQPPALAVDMGEGSRGLVFRKIGR